MRRQGRRNGRRLSRRVREDVNPMNYLSNLSDVMLILAVGIMLALILHWNVSIEQSSGMQEETQQEQNSVSFSQEDLQSMDSMPEDAKEMGNVYYDASTGKYYYVIDQGSE